MNLEKLMGLKEVLQEQLVKYATGELGLDAKYVGYSPQIQELSCIWVTGKGNLNYAIGQDDDIDDAKSMLGISGEPYGPSMCKEFAERPNHETMNVLEKAGYEIINVYPSKDERFVDVFYQRSGRSDPWVYAVVSKYVG